MSNPGRAEALRRADWHMLADRLLAGVSHDINGRAAALSAIAHMSETYGEAPAAGLLHQESRTLENIVELLSLLQGDLDGDPEPMAVGEHLPRLVELSSKGRGLDRVEVLLDVNGTAPPILVNWCLFFRSFLIVLDRMSNVACDLGSKQVSVECGPKRDGLHVGVVVLPTETDQPPGGHGHFETMGEKLASVADALASTGGSVSVRKSTSDLLAADFWFPSLSMARGRARPADRAEAC